MVGLRAIKTCVFDSRSRLDRCFAFLLLVICPDDGRGKIVSIDTANERKERRDGKSADGAERSFGVFAVRSRTESSWARWWWHVRSAEVAAGSSVSVARS